MLKVKYKDGSEEVFEKANDWEVDDETTTELIYKDRDKEKVVVAILFNRNVCSIQ